MPRLMMCLAAICLVGFPCTADAWCSQHARYLGDLHPVHERQETARFRADPCGGRTGEWEAMGPEGGYIKALVMDPTDPSAMYACVYTYPARVFKTTDRGGSWTLLSTINDYIMAMAIDPSTPTTLYAGAYGDVHKSTDGGLTWDTYSTQVSGNTHGLTVDPVNPNTVWGTGYHWDGTNSLITVLKSTSGGQTWAATQLYTADRGYGYCVAVDPVDNDIVYVGGYYRDGTNVPGLFRTTDGGGSWTETATGITDDPVYDIVIDPTVHTTVYAGVWNGTYKSTNGGDNWSDTGSGYYNYRVAVAHDAPGTVYSAQWEAVRKSTDGGGSWNTTGGGIFGNCLRSMLVDPTTSSRVYVGNYVGFFRTDNGGGTWGPANSGMLGKEANDIIVTGSTPHVLYAAIADDAIYRTTAGRATWTRLGDFVDCDEVEKMAVDPQDDDKIYALTGG